MRVLLLGGTDLTAAVGDALAGSSDVEVVGLVHVGERFTISYQPGGVANTRSYDLAGWAAEHDVPARIYENADTLHEAITEREPAFALVAGWYHMVPASVRERLPRGCAGLHASLLPDLRGGAPLPWAILSGRDETGMTLFELGDGVDDGPVYGSRTLPIDARTTVAELVGAAEAAAVELVAECVPRIARGELAPREQTGVANYCLQRVPDDGRIDWSRPATQIDRLVRAVGAPYPGAFTDLDGTRVTIWSAAPAPDAPSVLGAPGQIARLPGSDSPFVVTGDGVLELLEASGEDGESLMDSLRRSGNRRFAPR